MAPASGGGAMFRRFRWLTILLPVVLVTAAEIVSDSVLDFAFPIPLDILATAIVVLALSAGFSYALYARVDALSGAVERRNEELERRSARSAALHRVSMAISGLAGVDDVLACIQHLAALRRTVW